MLRVMKRGQPCGSDGLHGPFPSHQLGLSCFQAESRAGRRDFYFPGDRDIINYLPFPAASCQRTGRRKSTDRISAYPSTLLMGSSFNCHALSTDNTNYINYAPTQHVLMLALSRLVTFSNETSVVHQLYGFKNVNVLIASTAEVDLWNLKSV